MAPLILQSTQDALVARCCPAPAGGVATYPPMQPPPPALASAAPAPRRSFTRARTRERHRARRVLAHGALVGGRAAVLLVVALAVGAASAPTATAMPRQDAAIAAAEAPASTIPALGRRWFAIGANVPWLSYGCDFGCGRNLGVRGRRATADAMLRSMSRRGVRVVRWYLFPREAWQVRRAADGTPTAVDPAALLDLDEAVHLARRHDVYLLPVVIPEPHLVPASWFTDPRQATALAAALRPMFARYRGDRHVLGWELVTGADVLFERGVASREQLRRHAALLHRALRASAPGRLAAIGPIDVSHLDAWTGLGTDLYLPQDPAGLPAERCACVHAAALAASEGLDAPLVVGGYQADTSAEATSMLERYARLRYAGALAWSWRGLAHPQRPGVASPIQDDATWRFHHARPGSGPRSRPLNPCYGPRQAWWRCPNLRMSPPADVSLGRIGRRSILYSTNSLDSRGEGPASLRGTRDGRLTMAARQVLHRVGGGSATISTGARLLFKAIPGQYRYWKWNGAARMELWRLDSTGRPVELARSGPKTVYCLRDLKRRFGYLPDSPRQRVYPGCSQRLSQRTVTLGTSVGWSDVYPTSYHENWIDVTGLRGCFAYVHVADPTNVIYESNEDDNTSSVVVRLPFRGSNAGCPGARALPTIGDAGIY